MTAGLVVESVSVRGSAAAGRQARVDRVMGTVIGMDVPGNGLIVLYAAAAIPGAAYLLARVWKRERIS